MAPVKKVNDEVYVATDSIVAVDATQLQAMRRQAESNPRQRARICAHKDSQDRLHEMLIALTDKVYIRPHKHAGKSESFHIIEGLVTVVFFNDAGEIDEVIPMGDFRSGKTFYFRNDDARFHAPVIRSPTAIFHEITNGPFNRADTTFAPWAPEENDVAGAAAFMAALKQKLAAAQ